MTAQPVRNLIAGIICLALVAMGLAAAAARGQTKIGGQIAVLCSGGGLVQVTFDTDGKPTGDSHLCPDLALAILAAFEFSPPEVDRPDAGSEMLASQPLRYAAVLVPRAFHARGPPVSV